MKQRRSRSVPHDLGLRGMVNRQLWLSGRTWMWRRRFFDDHVGVMECEYEKAEFMGVQNNLKCDA